MKVHHRPEFEKLVLTGLKIDGINEVKLVTLALQLSNTTAASSHTSWSRLNSSRRSETATEQKILKKTTN